MQMSIFFQKNVPEIQLNLLMLVLIIDFRDFFRLSTRNMAPITIDYN